MQTRLSLRRLIDGTILLLIVITGWRILHVTRHPLADTSLVTPVTPAVRIGDIFRLPSVEWSAPRTVVLVISSTCPSCNANVPFYRKLASLATSQVQVVAVSAQPEAEIRDWFRQNQVDVRSIHRLVDPLSHGLTLTPMVLMVNAEGRITDLMIRKLDETDQARVLERVRQPRTVALDNSQQLREISTTDLHRITGRVQILDVRSRDHFHSGHRADARNIPSPELEARAPIELDLSSPVVVDCLQPKATACRGAAWTLIEAGFGDVSLLIR